MSEQLFISKDAFRDQRERMVEEWGIDKEEANEAFEQVKTQVMLASQDMGNGWSNETVEAVTNFVMSIQQQQHQNSQRRKSHFYGRLNRLLNTLCIGASTGAAVVHYISGSQAWAAFFAIIAVLTLIQFVHD